MGKGLNPTKGGDHIAYAAGTGNTACADADEGYKVASDGAASQTACAAGTYQNSVGQSSCIDCAVGYYAGGTGSTVCTAAAAGYYVSTTGASQQTDCAAGTFLLTGVSSWGCQQNCKLLYRDYPP